MCVCVETDVILTPLLLKALCAVFEGELVASVVSGLLFASGLSGGGGAGGGGGIDKTAADLPDTLLIPPLVLGESKTRVFCPCLDL